MKSEACNEDIKKVSLLPALFFSLIQFSTVTDNSSLMNASSAIANTFETNVANLQTANIMYPLMAGSVMIAGGALGRIFGWKKLIQTGLIVLIVGEMISILSINISMFIYCGRLLVGLGASLTIPAILGLITELYKKKQRSVVFGLIAATIALATAVSPVVSGLIIFYINWRVVFIGIAMLFFICFLYITFNIKNDNTDNNKKKFDTKGFILIFTGLYLVVMGFNTLGSWGILKPIEPPFTILGYSPSLLMILIGMAVIILFYIMENFREKREGVNAVLVPKAFIRDKKVFSAILMNSFIYIPLGGIIFIMFIILQIFFDADAVTTGFYLLVFALGMIPFSIGTPYFGGNFSPRAICFTGVIFSSAGAMFLGYGINVSDGINLLFFVGLVILGAGNGLVASQANFIAAASIKDEKLASQSSGLQGAMRNIGQAVSIAVIGVIFISLLTYNIKVSVNESNIFNSKFKEKIRVVNQVPTLTRQMLIKDLDEKFSLPPAQRKAMLNLYKSACINAYKLTNIIAGIFLLFFLFFVKNISNKKLSSFQKEQGES